MLIILKDTPDILPRLRKWGNTSISLHRFNPRVCRLLESTAGGVGGPTGLTSFEVQQRLHECFLSAEKDNIDDSHQNPLMSYCPKSRSGSSLYGRQTRPPWGELMNIALKFILYILPSGSTRRVWPLRN